MKKIVMIIVVMCVVINLYANQSFVLHVADKNIAIEDANAQIPTLLDCSKTTFEQFNKRTDDIGFTHLSFQQKFEGKPINGATVLVHAKNGIIQHINGQFVPDNELPQANAAKVTALRKATNNSDDLMLVTHPKTGEIRWAYKVYVEEKLIYTYVDAETGEVIYSVPLYANSDVQGTAFTLYKGWQPFTCDYNSTKNSYQLADNGRNILTVDASTSDTKCLYRQPDNQDGMSEEEAKEFAKQNFVNFLGTCQSFTSPMVNWAETHLTKTYLTSVTITSTPDKSWWYSIADTKPDLYVVIKDANNNQLYQSIHYSDCTLPFTFNLNIYLAAPNYILEIYDYDPVGTDGYGGSITISSKQAGTYTWSGTSTTGKITITNSGNPALDAHWGVEKTYDFYKNTFNRCSYDNKGSMILQFINPPHDENVFKSLPNNAFAKNFIENKYIWPDFIACGMGDGQLMTPVVALDIIAHEFTHLVTAYNGNGGLEYKGESGALNESFSDIFGHCVENYVNINPNWYIGEDVMVNYSNLRDMSNPSNSQGDGTQPDTYEGTYWASTTEPSETNDNGGVHKNSGVQNYWFYLLCEGGNGSNDKNNYYTVKGIGIEKAQRIAYRNLIYYLEPTANHASARTGSLLAAADLYGANSPEYKSVMNAWYAVGVGEAAGTTSGEYPSATVLIKAKVPANSWTAPCIWYWGGGDNPNNANPMILVGPDNNIAYNWYAFELPNNITGFLFKNIADGETWALQSTDTDVPTEATCYQLSSINKSIATTMDNCPVITSTEATQTTEAVYAQGGIIYSTLWAEVYDLMGKKIGEGTAIHVDGGSVYVVKTANGATKIHVD